MTNNKDKAHNYLKIIPEPKWKPYLIYVMPIH
jgi:hypothetical protein